jgi:hypothetical protein
MCSWKEARRSLFIKKTGYHKVFSVYRFIPAFCKLFRQPGIR